MGRVTKNIIEKIILNLIGDDFQYINFSMWDGDLEDDEGESNCKGLQRKLVYRRI